MLRSFWFLSVHPASAMQIISWYWKMAKQQDGAPMKNFWNPAKSTEKSMKASMGKGEGRYETEKNICPSTTPYPALQFFRNPQYSLWGGQRSCPASGADFLR